MKEESWCSLSCGLGGLCETRNISWLTKLEVNKLPLSSLFITKVCTTRGSRMVHIPNSAFWSRSLLSDPIARLSRLFLCLSKIQNIHVFSWGHWTIFHAYNILLLLGCAFPTHIWRRIFGKEPGKMSGRTRLCLGAHTFLLAPPILLFWLVAQKRKVVSSVLESRSEVLLLYSPGKKGAFFILRLLYFPHGVGYSGLPNTTGQHLLR